MGIHGRNAQHVGLAIGDEADWYKRTEVSPDVNVVGILPASDDPAFPLLCQVDEYGTTVFNQDQLPDVRAEWLRLKAEASPAEADLIDDAVNVIDQVLAVGSPASLVFLGD
jgi:hypothetical protein